jgi:hypothetical protein
MNSRNGSRRVFRNLILRRKRYKSKIQQKVEFIYSPSHLNVQTSGVFTIKASGHSGEAEISFQSKDHVELFECAGLCRAKYRFESVHGFLKALAASSKVCLRMNEEEILSAQFLMEGGGVETFLEFTVAPLI